MFEEDPYPGKPKILFIGHPSSSHTISWIDLLRDDEFNVRLFGLPTGLPPDDWKVKTYLTVPELPAGLDIETRLWFYPRPEEKVEIRNAALTLEAMRQNLVRQEHLVRMAARQEMQHRFNELNKLLHEYHVQNGQQTRTLQDSLIKLLKELELQSGYQSKTLYNSLKELLKENSFTYKLGKTLRQFKNSTLGPSRKGASDNRNQNNDPADPLNNFDRLDENFSTELLLKIETPSDAEENNSNNLGTDEKEPNIADLIPPQPQVIYDTRYPSMDEWLSAIIQQWQPDIIHTLGLDPAGIFYHQTRKKYQLGGSGKWVLQLRGGSDLTLSRFDVDRIEIIADSLKESDCIVSDNLVNIAYAQEMGIESDKFSSICPVPGTGGIDIEEFSGNWIGNPSTRRNILWPKAYDSPWSLALPVIEALKLAWDSLQPCEVHILAATPDVRKWLNALPDEIKDHCHIDDRIDRQEVHELMAASRVMLAPSLVDGVPNTLYEAMASGAFPIVSPLVTITPVVKAEENVLFARNLYPDEIAQALKRAMTDDQLVDDAAARNLQLVRKLANREVIKSKVVDFYHQMTLS